MAMRHPRGVVLAGALGALAVGALKTYLLVMCSVAFGAVVMPRDEIDLMRVLRLVTANDSPLSLIWMGSSKSGMQLSS